MYHAGRRLQRPGIDSRPPAGYDEMARGFHPAPAGDSDDTYMETTAYADPASKSASLRISIGALGVMAPVAVQQLINNLFNMIDNLMVGSLDASGLAMSAVTVANRPYTIFFGVFFGMTGAAGAAHQPVLRRARL